MVGMSPGSDLGLGLLFMSPWRLYLSLCLLLSDNLLLMLSFSLLV